MLGRLRHISGEVIWKRFFGETMAVSPIDLVPYQFGTVMAESLRSADEKVKEFEAAFNFKEQAKAKFAELRKLDEQQKAERKGPYSPY